MTVIEEYVHNLENRISKPISYYLELEKNQILDSYKKGAIDNSEFLYFEAEAEEYYNSLINRS